MTPLGFYLRYAFTHLRHSGHWTTFALFCVAAGVATVVALRSLGLAISDALVSNLRQYNHGDINLSMVFDFGPFAGTFQRGADERSVFQDWQVRSLEEWTQAREASMTAYTLLSNIQITPVVQQGFGRPQFTSSFLIDPQTFSISGDILALDPAGVPLRELLKGGNELVISQNLAEAQQLKVGDSVRVSGTEQLFTVTGIVPTESEASINNLLAAFFGFAYFDRSVASTLSLSPAPNFIGIVLPDGSTSADIEAAAFELLQDFRVPNMSATPWLLERNRELADLLGRFIVAMGLGALLIGGVGIMNTMLVLVGRRTMEIAALKTFGLKGQQVAALFITEAFLLGVLGSALGVVAGVLMSGLVNQFGEAFLQQSIPWRFYPEAALYGSTLGLVVTMVFGVLPVLLAARVRPAIVLRPNETHIPRAGLFHSLIALLVVVIVLGIVSGNIMAPALEYVPGSLELNPLLVGVLAVLGVVIFLGLLVGVMWLIVWLIGRLPTLGWVDLRLALRNLSSRRIRTATTLLALSAGMFALSSISYFGLGAREIVRFQFAQTLGGNVMIIPLVPDAFVQPVIDTLVRSQPGVQAITQLNLNTGRITRVDGAPLLVNDEERTLGLRILTRDTNNTLLNSGFLIAGRDLTPEDRGQRVIVLSELAALEAAAREIASLEEAGISVGSIVTLRVGRTTADYEVVGIVTGSNGLTPTLASAYIPPQSLTDERSYRLNVAQIDPAYLNEFLTNITAIPLMFAIDVSFIDGLLARLIDQLAAIPTLVGLLSLLAAAVIMANTVSLTILERRKQIGILKALGLKRGRVLRIILLENTVIGLVGGLTGVGLSSLGVSLLTLLGAGSSIPVPREATLLTFGLLLASVVIAWIATLLSARVAIGETVLRVLRYE